MYYTLFWTGMDRNVYQKEFGNLECARAYYLGISEIGAHSGKIVDYDGEEYEV